MKALVWLCVATFFTPVWADQRLVAASQFLEENKISESYPAPADYSDLYQQIEQLADPETKFGYLVFSVARHREKLLSDEQGDKLTGLIEARKNAEVNWHDVRNIVRVHAVFELWNYAAANEEADIKRHRELWQKWTDLRVAYMYEEFISKERFQRQFWQILTPVQRRKLLSGEWDKYLKKSTGHKRLYSAEKQVTRELGKPGEKAEFAEVSELWRQQWQPMIEPYWQASVFQQKREMAMDLVGEEFAAASWQEYAKAFKDFATMECEAIRQLVQVGYPDRESVLEKVAKTQQKFRSQMIEKYQANAGGFLQHLSVSADQVIQ